MAVQAAAAPFGAPAATPAFGQVRLAGELDCALQPNRDAESPLAVQTTPATGFGAAATPAFGGGGFGGATTSFGAQAQPASAFGVRRE